MNTINLPKTILVDRKGRLTRESTVQVLGIITELTVQLNKLGEQLKPAKNEPNNNQPTER